MVGICEHAGISLYKVPEVRLLSPWEAEGVRVGGIGGGVGRIA